MGLLERAMDVYRYLFHPLVVIAVTVLVVAACEWRRDGGSWRALAARFGAVGVATALALVPVGGLVLLAGRRAVGDANVWYVDLSTAAGLCLASAVAWAIWSRRDWGRAVPGALAALVVTAVPFAALSLAWNVSGHVAFTAVPTLYLALLDRRFWPTLSIPVVMVANRPIVGAHTWPQSVGGLALGVLGVLVATTYYDRLTDGPLTLDC